MPNIPSHIRLQPSVTDVSDHNRMKFWLQKEKDMYERISTKRRPDVIDLGKGMEGVTITISTWQKIIRSWYEKVLSVVWHSENPMVTKESIPASDGDMEVQMKMKANIEALLAWTKDSVTNLDIPHLYNLCTDVAGHELLGENICVVYGKYGEKRKLASVSTNTERATVPPLKAESLHMINGQQNSEVDSYQCFIDEVERKFHRHIPLSDTPEEQKKSELGILESSGTKDVLQAFREAHQLGISRTELFISKSPKGIVSIITQQHPVKGRKSENTTFKVQTEIFRLHHLLRKYADPSHIFWEGFSSLEKILQFQEKIPTCKFVIPGTTIPVLSAEGQEHLYDHPEMLVELLRANSNVQMEYFPYFVWLEQFPLVHGAEHPEVNYNTDDGLDEMHSIVQSGDYSFEKRERFVRIFRQVSEYNAIRNKIAIQHMREAIEGGIPHLVFGESHKYDLLNNCAEEGWSVILTTPSSLPNIPAQGYAAFVADERNPLYRKFRNV